MNDTARLGLLLSLAACTAPAALAEEIPHYVESEGAVVFEVESAVLADGWTLDTELPDHLGDGYIVWEGGNYYRFVEAGEGAMTFHFTITNPGNYQLLWRSRIARGESDKEHNDSWARMSTGADVPDEQPLDSWTKAYMNDLDTWSWATKTVDTQGLPLRQYFSAGDHTLEISGRSTGHAIDRVVLIAYETRSQRPDALDALPVSATSGGSGTTGGEDDYIPVNASGLTAESTTPVDAVSQCVDERLVLAPLADVHEDGGDYADENALRFGGDARALLKFDLRAVSAPTTAALRYTTLDTLESGVDFALGAHAEWPDAADAPDFLASLGEAEARWQANARYESALDASLLQPAFQTILLSGAPGDDVLSVASSEDAERGALLVLEGESGFCATREQMLEAIAAEEAALEEPPVVVEEPPVVDEPVEIPPVSEPPVVEPAVTPVIEEPVSEPPTVATPTTEAPPRATVDIVAAGVSIWLLLLGAFVGALRRRVLRAS